MKIHPGCLAPFLLLGSCNSTEGPAPAQAPAPAAASPAPRAVEPAIEAGLGWLARHQEPDGSWRAKDVDAACRAPFDHGHPQGQWVDRFDSGVTALCALAFVRAGRSDGPATKAVAWLRAQQNAQGFFSGEQSFIYNDALATLALSEQFAATKESSLREPAQRAVDFLVKAQRPSPSGEGAWGWRYQSRMEIEQKFGAKEPSEQEKRELYDSDVSVTGWCVAALAGAERAGLKVDPAALKGAAEFVRWCRGRDGLVGYNDPKNAGLTVQGRNDNFDYHKAGMPSIALRVALETGSKAEDPFLESAARIVASDPPSVSANGLSIDYYYWLNGTLALASYAACGSPQHRAAWDESLHDVLLGLQAQKPGSCGDGGWLVPDRWSYAGGPVYTTAMALLALEQKG